LFRTESETWDPRIFAPWGPRRSGCASIHPDGRTLCLLLYDSGEGASYLVQRDTRWSALDRVGPRLTGPGAAIVPGSVQYSPDGALVAYVRRESATTSQLWVVAPDGRESNGQCFATGALGAYSFSPDGRRIALSIGEGEKARTSLVPLAAGGAPVDLAGCSVSSECWHPSGSHLIVTASDEETGAVQLWRVDARRPDRRSRLTAFPNGVLPGAAVSRDGRWAAVAAYTGNGPVLVFVDLGALMTA